MADRERKEETGVVSHSWCAALADHGGNAWAERFLAAEGIRGKPVEERLQVLLTVMGVVFLLGLIVVLSIKDVGTLLQLFG